VRLKPSTGPSFGLDKAKFLGADVSECSVPTIVFGTVFGYDTSKLAEGPTSINDLFDLAKFPGKRGLQKNPTVNLEWALIADGVPAADVYKTLATPEGVDRAFKKLDTIKSEIVWWEAGAQAPQLLADGQVVMTSAWNGRLQKPIDVDGKPFKIVWDHQALDWICGRSPRVHRRWKKPIASSLSLPVQGLRPSRPSTLLTVPPILTPFRTSSRRLCQTFRQRPTNLKTAWNLDTQFWADHGDELKERFNAWIAQ
jgi:putative spermidine/putrescine transport system substrate-binding protein